MKSISIKCLLIIILQPLFLLIAACGGDDPAEPITDVRVNTTSLTFSNYNGSETQDLVITSSSLVSAKADDVWCVLNRAESNSGTYLYKVTPTTNLEQSSRTTTIRITKDKKEVATVAVSQAGRPDMNGTQEGLFGSLGWNYGNQMDAHNNGVSNETAWTGVKATQATFDGVKKAGFQTVRIPITWLGHIGSAPDYKIESAWMKRVAELVEYCENAGLNAIINIHHDGADSQYWLNIKKAATSTEKEAEITEELVAIWKQIAEKFKDKGEWLMFETMNEIQDGGWGWGDNLKDNGKQYAVLNRWNQACVDAIRAVGGNNTNRWIGVPGYSTNIDLTLKNLVVPNDPSNRVAVAVHCYDPYQFTLECAQNTYTSSDITGIKSQFAQLKKKYIDNGVQCYVGEFGCVQRADESKESNRLKYLKEFAQAAKQYGLSIILWDNNADNNGKGGKECNAFINHATGNYFSEKGKAAVEAIVDGYK